MDEEKFKEIVHEKTVRIRELSQQLPVKDEQINGLRGMVKELERTILARDQTILQLKAKKAEISRDVFVAYEQRAKLLYYFTTFLPSIIKYDLDATNPDFANVLYVVLPHYGQISFHLWVGHLDNFKNTPMTDYHGRFIEPYGGDLMEKKAIREGVKDLVWDNHTNEDKWYRFKSFCLNHLDKPVESIEDEDKRSTWYPAEAKNSMRSPRVGHNSSSEGSQSIESE